MKESLAWSRPERSAGQIGSDAPDRHRFTKKNVLLTGETAVLSTRNGRCCFLDCLLLLVRTCRNVFVAIPEDCRKLRAECESLAARICFQTKVAFPRLSDDYSNFDAILSVGSKSRADMPWTVVNSNGWLARVSSRKTDICSVCDQFNPVAALAAASLGVCEVFKRLNRLKDVRGSLLDGLTYCLNTHKCGVTNPGPILPTEIFVDLLVVGVGAIGNGILHLLTELPLYGTVRFLDPQSFGDENWGTCLMIGPENIGESKAEFAERALKRNVNAKAYRMRIEDFASRIVDIKETYPRQIVCGLDNVQARHEAQMLWPELLVDGAIGTFPCQVTRWSWESASACLRCVFQKPNVSAQATSRQATGLGESRTLVGESIVTEADAAAAPANRVAWLRERIGRKVCSVIEEGIANQLSEDEHDESFAPSVPFVACMSASMVVAELIAHVAGWRSQVETRFQFDLLRGPKFGEMYAEDCSERCFRFERKRAIELHRLQRQLARQKS